jgi:hypothetical protein
VRVRGGGGRRREEEGGGGRSTYVLYGVYLMLCNIYCEGRTFGDECKIMFS